MSRTPPALLSFVAVVAIGLAAGCDDGSDASQPDASRPDAARPDAAPPDLGPPPKAAECFDSLPGERGPDYDQFGPVIGRHCKGTNHQDIAGVQRAVFLGDSVTTGTPPTRAAEFYRERLGEMLKTRFGDDLEIADCSAFGARTDDFLIGRGEVEQCFPEGGDAKRTLVIFTIGGNDIFAWAQDALSLDDALRESEIAAGLLGDTIAWFREAARFPNGVYIVFANPYEYTDATGDLASCELAVRLGITDNWISGADAVVHFQERFMEIAVEYQVDLVFSLEHFCGHGYHRDDPTSQCYRGPDAELWFDFTCIHPNSAGHAALADLFIAVIDE